MMNVNPYSNFFHVMGVDFSMWCRILPLSNKKWAGEPNE